METAAAEPNYIPERRPIAARSRPWAVAIADRLARWGVSPNAISVAGMFAGIMAGIAFALTSHGDYGWVGFLVAAVGMQLRLLANMFDGMVAIQTAQASPVGGLYNEVPDRISDTAIFVGAGYALYSHPEFGYLAAIGALFTAYVRAQGKAAGARNEFCGPMAKQHRMAVLTIAALYAGLLPRLWQPALGHLATIDLALVIIVAGTAITSARRLFRIARTLREIKA